MNLQIYDKAMSWKDVCRVLFEHLDLNDCDQQLVDTVYDLIENESFDDYYIQGGDLADEIHRLRKQAAQERYYA